VNDAHLGLRIGHLLKTQEHTPIACVDALWHITYWHDVVDVLKWDRAFGEATLDSLRVLKGSHDPAIALTAYCTAALGVRVVLKDLRRMLTQAPTKRLRILELRKALYALMDIERATLEAFTDDEEFIWNVHLLNLAGVLTGAVPLLVGVDKTRSSVLWDTLDALRSGFDDHETSSAAQTAIVDAWGVYEAEAQAWTPTAGVFPRRMAGSMDRYRSRMEELVAPIVQDIGSRRIGSSSIFGESP
jgi:hypothetical protein